MLMTELICFITELNFFMSNNVLIDSSTSLPDPS